MCQLIKYNYLSAIYFLITIIRTGHCIRNREIILTEDRPYDVIDIKIPLHVWKKAINPTPILKSRATITIPVQVNDEYIDNDDDEDNEISPVIQDIVVNSTAVVDDETPVQEDTVVAEDTPADPIAEAPVQEEVVNDTPPASNDPPSVTDPQPTVTGQAVRFPCSCVDGQCGCCTGMFLQRLRMNTCGNISFVPEDFVFDVRMSVNNATVIRRRVSASDPPPICFNPRRIPFVQVCAEISNIRIRNRNAFACLDINADIGGFPVFSTSFRCFGLGTSGVQTGLKPKPVSSGPKPVNLFGGGTSESSSGGGDGSFLSNAAGAVLAGGSSDGLLDGVAEGIFGGGDDAGGPLDAIGDALGGIRDIFN